MPVTLGQDVAAALHCRVLRLYPVVKQVDGDVLRGSGADSMGSQIQIMKNDSYTQQTRIIIAVLSASIGIHNNFMTRAVANRLRRKGISIRIWRGFWEFFLNIPFQVDFSIQFATGLVRIVSNKTSTKQFSRIKSVSPKLRRKSVL